MWKIITMKTKGDSTALPSKDINVILNSLMEDNVTDLSKHILQFPQLKEYLWSQFMLEVEENSRYMS